jgi:hypothetical protein
MHHHRLSQTAYPHCTHPSSSGPRIGRHERNIGPDDPIAGHIRSLLRSCRIHDPYHHGLYAYEVHNESYDNLLYSNDKE